MKKISLVLGGLLLGLSTIVWAQTPPPSASTATYNLTVTVPHGTVLGFLPTLVIPDPNDCGGKKPWLSSSTVAPVPDPTTGLPTLTFDFGPLTLKTFTTSGKTFKIFSPTDNHYFAIDVSPANGAGTPTNFTATYTEGANPNSDPNKGLGSKAVATFVRTDGTPTGEVALMTPNKYTLNNLKITKTIDTGSIASTTGTWLRIYVGLSTGNTDGTTGCTTYPSDSSPFTTGDKPGTYTGTLTFSGTVL